MVDCRPLLPAAAALFALSSLELPTNDLRTRNQRHCLRQSILNHRHRQRQRGGDHKYGARAFGINSRSSERTSRADGSGGGHRHDDDDDNDAALDNTPKDAEGAVGLQTSKSEVLALPPGGRHRPPPRVCVVVDDDDVTDADRRAKPTATTTKMRTDDEYECECEATTEGSGGGSSRAAAAAPVGAATVHLARQLGLPLRRLGRHRGDHDDDEDVGPSLPVSILCSSMEDGDDYNDYTHELRYVPWRTAPAAAAADGDDPVVGSDVALEIRALTNKNLSKNSISNQRSKKRPRDADALSMVVDWVRILHHGGSSTGMSSDKSVGAGIMSSPRRPGMDRLVQAVWGGSGSGRVRAVRRRDDGSNDPLCVADLTAGWGTDALTLLMAAPSNNCRGLLVEQDPVVAAMLRDAHRRLQRHEQEGVEQGTTTFADRIMIVEGDGADVAARCALGEDVLPPPSSSPPRTVAQPSYESFAPHVVYLDPMFPPRTKSAAVKKPMQVLHSLLQTHVAQHTGTADAESTAPHLHPQSKLLEAARQWARERVVVKRPLKAEPLGGMTPSFCLEGGNHRWDVYLTPPSPSHS